MVVKHNINVSRISYPFGEKMDKNSMATDTLIDGFLKAAKKDLESTEEVTIVCMGSSGAIIATMFYQAIRVNYRKMQIKICHVKKDGESAHGGRVSGLSYDKNSLYIWVDDFIDKGHTVMDCHSLLVNGRYTDRIKEDFKFNYIICSYIGCLNKVENLSNNLIYNFE